MPRRWSTTFSAVRTGRTLWRCYTSSSGPMALVTTFAIGSKAMSRDKVIAGWKDPRRYTRAYKMLLARGAIKPVSRARRDTQGCWTAAKYKFTKPGEINAPNITTHPSPLAPNVSKTC